MCIQLSPAHNLTVSNSYRYGHDGAYDVQPAGMKFSASSDSKAPKASSSEHSGQWRDHGDGSSLGQFCSLPGQQEGPVCAHGSGIITTSHWSCCGARKRDASCKPGGDSDDDSSSSSEDEDAPDSGAHVFGSDDVPSFIRQMMKSQAEAGMKSRTAKEVYSRGNHSGHVWYGCAAK